MQRKIKIINIVSFSLIFISLTAIFVFLKFPSLLNNSFQIKNVIIEGSEKSNISEIENNVTEFKGNLIGLNFNSIKEIVESSEWVKRASIKKILPSTLNSPEFDANFIAKVCLAVELVKFDVSEVD